MTTPVVQDTMADDHTTGTPWAQPHRMIRERGPVSPMSTGDRPSIVSARSLVVGLLGLRPQGTRSYLRTAP